jgi:hypothetical protein
MDTNYFFRLRSHRRHDTLVPKLQLGNAMNREAPASHLPTPPPSWAKSAIGWSAPNMYSQKEPPLPRWLMHLWPQVHY